ncbi:thioredoxin [Radicibacter daui]|uniref:thioredoxin n=1 Tax=Radicibacter daui TaxID=3064829 RepID=UPI00404696F7
MSLFGMGSGNPNGAAPAAAPQAAAAPAGALIKDTDIRSFAADVLDVSRSVPVIVEFWATWCGPCKQLMPTLEKLVTQAGGAVRMVKVDIDKNQQLAAQLRIQSVPTVYAFYQGQPVDAFQGALPESQVKQWIDHLIKSTSGAGPAAAIEEALAAAKQALDEGDIQTAGGIYQQIVQADPENAPAYAGMIRCLMAAGQTEQAAGLLADLPPEIAGHAEVKAAATALALAEQAGAARGATGGLEARLAADANDHQARFDLAMALYAEGRNEEAAEALIEIVRRDRTWNEDAARAQLVKFFEAWGAADKLTLRMRRRLSSVMFS